MKHSKQKNQLQNINSMNLLENFIMNHIVLISVSIALGLLYQIWKLIINNLHGYLLKYCKEKCIKIRYDETNQNIRYLTPLITNEVKLDNSNEKIFRQLGEEENKGFGEFDVL